MTSRELASAAGVTLSTIHYYTSLGLLPVSRRVGNKRLFNSAETMSRLKRIAQLRGQGYPLSLIRQELSKRKEVFDDRA